MQDKLSRRDALRWTAAIGASSLAVQSARLMGNEEANDSRGDRPAVRQSSETGGLSTYLYGGQAQFRWNNVVVATYRACPLEKFPYFGNLTGPISGNSLTTECSMPCPHHRGVWLGCDPLNGGDYWKDGPLATGQIRSLGLELCEPMSHSVTLRNRCQWIRRGEGSPLYDERTIKFSVYSDLVRLIDFDIRLTALDRIQIKKAKHSLFALRAAPDISPTGGGKLTNAAGDEGESGTHGKPSSWCGYYGSRAAHEGIVEGIAVMDHPDNPWSPCAWFTRDYGHLSPSPFNFLERPWELEEGESIRLRYRVAMHAGNPHEAGLQRIYKEWLTD